jgi:hypothetical protein
MPPSLAETYLAELVAILLFKIWRGKKPTLSQFNNLRQFISNCIVPTQLTYPVVIQALAYVHRLKQRFPNLPDLEGSECRVFLVGLIVANKHLDDCNYTNKVWSQVSSITNEEINMMEMEYLEVMEFDTFLNPDYVAVFTSEMKSLAESMGLDQVLVECAQEIATHLNGTYQADDMKIMNTRKLTAVSKKSISQASIHQRSGPQLPQDETSKSISMSKEVLMTPKNKTIQNTAPI